MGTEIGPGDAHELPPETEEPTDAVVEDLGLSTALNPGQTQAEFAELASDMSSFYAALEEGLTNDSGTTGLVLEVQPTGLTPEATVETGGDRQPDNGKQTSLEDEADPEPQPAAGSTGDGGSDTPNPPAGNEADDENDEPDDTSESFEVREEPDSPEDRTERAADPPVMELLNYGRATTPVVEGEKLVYPNLVPLPDNIDTRIDAFAEGGDTPAAQAVRRQLVDELHLSKELIQVAAELQIAEDPAEQRALAAAYTDIHERLHGVPDEQIARDALAMQYHDIADNFEQLEDPARQDAAQRFMDLAHQVFGDTVPPPEFDPRLAVMLDALHPEVSERFAPALEVLDTIDPEQTFTAPEIAALAERCIENMATVDPEWAHWTVEVVPGNIFATDKIERQFRIGSSIEKQGNDCKQTLVHDFGHAKRGNSAYRVGLPQDLDKVSFGLRDVPEEGTVVLLDKSYTGEMQLSPYKQGGSLYLDTALAYGAFSGIPPMSRTELTEVLYDREQARIDLHRTPEQSALAARKAAARFYRGTPASNESNTGVSTIGLLYRNQFWEVVNTTHTLRQGGMEAGEIVDYYLAAPINPNDSTQNTYMAELYERAGDLRAVGLIQKAAGILGRGRSES